MVDYLIRHKNKENNVLHYIEKIDCFYDTSWCREIEYALRFQCIDSIKKVKERLEALMVSPPNKPYILNIRQVIDL